MVELKAVNVDDEVVGFENAEVYYIKQENNGPVIGELHIYRDKYKLGKTINELGIYIDGRYRQQGYAHEAIKKAKDMYQERLEAMDENQRKELWTRVISSNIPSIALHSKLVDNGIVVEKRQGKEISHYGEEIDMNYFRLV